MNETMTAVAPAVAPVVVPPMATPPETVKKVNTMFSIVRDTLEHLANRWQDEKEYEDLAEYGEVLKKKLPEGFELVRMTSRPFGFKFKVDGLKGFSVFVTAKKIGWKRTF